MRGFTIAAIVAASALAKTDDGTVIDCSVEKWRFSPECQLLCDAASDEGCGEGHSRSEERKNRWLICLDMYGEEMCNEKRKYGEDMFENENGNHADHEDHDDQWQFADSFPFFMDDSAISASASAVVFASIAAISI